MATPKMVVFREFKISQYKPRIRDAYRVVSWNNGDPQFEIRREFKNKEEDGWRFSHARGLRIEDLIWVLENSEEIKQVLIKAKELIDKEK